jgi:segregation and condensation protein B
MAENNIKSVIESLLFASEKPLMIEQIKAVLGGIDSTKIRELLQEMQLDFEQAKRGIRIIEVAGGFRMITAPDTSPFLRKFFRERKVERLSKPALETLAIIAYKQPVTKLEIESFRNVNVDGVISSLLDKSLIRVAGRKKAPGSPFVFGTTRQFLEYFGLNSLDELPKMEEFSSLANDPRT